MLFFHINFLDFIKENKLGSIKELPRYSSLVLYNKSEIEFTSPECFIYVLNILDVTP